MQNKIRKNETSKYELLKSIFAHYTDFPCFDCHSVLHLDILALTSHILFVTLGTDVLYSDIIKNKPHDGFGIAKIDLFH